jgi:hypothetical protein
MSRTALSLVVAAVVVASFAAGRAFSEDPANEAEMMRLGQPGPEHAVLKGWEGSWTGSGTYTPARGAPPTPFTSTLTSKMTLGGRFLESRGIDDFGGMKMESVAYLGYDNSKKKYVNVMLYDMSTAIGTSEGPYDAATKTFTMTGTESMGDKTRSIKYVMRMDGPDQFSFEVHFDAHKGVVGTMKRSK